MSSPRNRWRRTRRRNIPVYVGNFFERIAAKVLKAQFSKVVEQDEGDLLLKKIATGIEVKSGDNNNKLRIPIDQLERYESNTGNFPARFEHFLYCLCCYRNKESTLKQKKFRRSLLATCRTDVEVYSVLSQQTDTMYIFEYPILTALKRYQGISTGMFPCQNDRETIEISRGLLKKFSVPNGNNILSHLGLEPNDWRIVEREVHIPINFGLPELKLDFKLEIDAVFVMTHELFSKLSGTINFNRVGPIRHRRIEMPSSVTLSRAAV